MFRPSFLWPSTVYGLIPTTFPSTFLPFSPSPSTRGRMRRIVSFSRGLINTIPVIVLSSSWREFLDCPRSWKGGENRFQIIFPPWFFSFSFPPSPNVLERTKKMGGRISRIFFENRERERRILIILQFLKDFLFRRIATARLFFYLLEENFHRSYRFNLTETRDSN